MYVIDVRIENLQSEISTLERINETIDEMVADKVDEAIDAMRMVVDEQLDAIIEEALEEVDLSMMDGMFESDIEGELREDFVDRVRNEF